MHQNLHKVWSRWNTIKVNASKIAARGGASTIIANGFLDDVLLKIFRGLNVN